MKTQVEIENEIIRLEIHLDKICKFYAEYPEHRKELELDIQCTKVEILKLKWILSK